MGLLEHLQKCILTGSGDFSVDLGVLGVDLDPGILNDLKTQAASLLGSSRLAVTAPDLRLLQDDRREAEVESSESRGTPGSSDGSSADVCDSCTRISPNQPALLKV
jgi:hypothetical protein